MVERRTQPPTQPPTVTATPDLNPVPSARTQATGAPPTVTASPIPDVGSGGFFEKLGQMMGLPSLSDVLVPKSQAQYNPPKVTATPDTNPVPSARTQAKGGFSKEQTAYIEQQKARRGIPDQSAAGEAPAYDPNALALQMFFQSTIAPYLNQLAGNMGSTAQNYGQAISQIQPQMNPSLRQFFDPAQRQAQVQSYANALAGSAAAAPQLDQLMSQIQQAAEMQRFLAYQEMQSRAAQGANDFLSLISGQQAGGETGGAGGDQAALQAEMQKRASGK